MATLHQDQETDLTKLSNGTAAPRPDADPQETTEWLDALEYVLQSQGPERAQFLLRRLWERAAADGLASGFPLTTPYVNTIPRSAQPVYPGDRDIERRIKSIIRWNALAMVVKANKVSDGIGGHMSTFASAATLYEVGFNHFFHAPSADHPGDQIYFQGHSSPGIYSRAYVEGRLTAKELHNFRRELGEGGGLSSYPHPWLMPGFWQFPTVSMGLGPLMAIYQARFNRYLEHRGLVDTSNAHVWAFLGDGETDEPESLGALTLASREHLDNLTFVINCNLQRLDGPVRGNGKIIQELEGAFRGAGWNVIKVIWGDDWDTLLERDHTGLLALRMEEVLDGDYQKFCISDGSYIREKFFGKYPELLDLVSHMSDDELKRLRRGGHDPEKVYAAYQAAMDHKGQPTVILAKTIKGYGLGEAGEGKNIAHNAKKANEEELKAFRTRFEIPIPESDVTTLPFYRPDADSPEMKYLHERRQELGGYVPTRTNRAPALEAPRLEKYQDMLKGSGGRPASTTTAFGALLQKLLHDPQVGKSIVPIIPDEARTFGMEGLFANFGIYNSNGQKYQPVDFVEGRAMYYKEARDGQILQEGINEAGGMASFIAAGSSYATFGRQMIPFFIYYSMFGFQRVGDLIWLAGDMRVRGFLMGGTAGRTTLNGEGLQHEDGHSHLLALPLPNLEAYDPAWGYEITTIVLDGIRRMNENQEDILYYITVHNENYEQPPIPGDVTEGILKGMYPYSTVEAGPKAPMVQLFGSGAILRETLRAQQILAEKYQVSSQVWSVTSYKALHRDATDCERWNLLHPTEKPRLSYLEQRVAGLEGPFVAASDNVRALPRLISPWIPGGLHVLGTDGFGRSETRQNLRRFFEVDAECVTVAALYQLAKRGKLSPQVAAQAIKDLKVDAEKPNPNTV